MKRRMTLMIPLALFLITACAGIGTKARLEKFGRISEAYEESLRSADFRSACKFLHASIPHPSAGEAPYRNIEVVEYKVLGMDVSPDRSQIDQEIELQYFRLNSNRLRTTRHHQVWRYDEAESTWRLHSRLPVFTP